MIIRKSAQEIEGMARAGELVQETLQLVAGRDVWDAVRPRDLLALGSLP